MSKRLLLLKFLATLMNYFDYLTTIIGVRKYGCKEINPIGRWLLKNDIRLILIKIVLVSLVIGFFMDNELNLIIFIVVFSLVSINNYINILKAKRRLKKNGS